MINQRTLITKSSEASNYEVSNILTQNAAVGMGFLFVFLTASVILHLIVDAIPGPKILHLTTFATERLAGPYRYLAAVLVSAYVITSLITMLSTTFTIVMLALASMFHFFGLVANWENQKKRPQIDWRGFGTLVIRTILTIRPNPTSVAIGITVTAGIECICGLRTDDIILSLFGGISVAILHIGIAGHKASQYKPDVPESARDALANAGKRARRKFALEIIYGIRLPE